MAYERFENLGSYGERRVVGILTQTNIIGLVGGFVLTWQLGALLGIPLGGVSIGTFLRLGLCIIGGAAGIVVTFRWTGMSLWDRMVLWVMFVWRQRTGKTRVRPAVAPARPGRNAIAPVIRDGRVLVAPYHPDSAGQEGRRP